MKRCERRYLIPPLWHTNTVTEQQCPNQAVVMTCHISGAVLYLCSTCRNDVTNYEGDLQDLPLSTS